MLDSLGELLSRLTKTRADYLDVAISSRLSSAIKSIQYGTVSVPTGGSNSGAVTITAVTIGKAVLINLGWITAQTSAVVGNQFPYITLTNSTTVTAYTSSGVTANVVTSFVVVEFW